MLEKKESKVGQVPTFLPHCEATSEAVKFDEALEACAKEGATSHQLVGPSRPKLTGGRIRND